MARPLPKVTKSSIAASRITLYDPDRDIELIPNPTLAI
jgi:hypothetical protein